MISFANPVHQWRTTGPGLNMSFAWTRPSSKAGGVVVSYLPCFRRIVTTHARRRIIEIVVGGKSASPSPVESGEDGPTGQIDERVVVNHPVIRIAVGGRGDDTVADSRTPVGVALMPHEHVAVNFDVICRAYVYRH